jgi:hypothetical protein
MIDGSRTMCPRTVCPQRKVLDVLSLGQCFPWMMWPYDIASLRHGVHDQYVQTLDCIEEVLVKVSNFGL